MEPERTSVGGDDYIFFSYRAGVRMNTYENWCACRCMAFNLKSNAEDYIKLNVYAILTLQYIYTIVGKIYYIFTPSRLMCAFSVFTCLLHNITMIWMMREGGKKGSFGLHILKICRHRRLKRIGAATTTIRKNQKTNWIIIYWVDSILVLKFGLLLNRYIYIIQIEFSFVKMQIIVYC